MSKKVVRLTESQLRLMINKVINEQKTPVPPQKGKSQQPQGPQQPILKDMVGRIIQLPYIKDEETLNRFLSVGTEDLQRAGFDTKQWSMEAGRDADAARDNPKGASNPIFKNNPNYEQNRQNEWSKAFRNSALSKLISMMGAALNISACFSWNGDDFTGNKVPAEYLLTFIDKYVDQDNWKQMLPSEMLKNYWFKNGVMTQQYFLNLCKNIVDNNIKEIGGDPSKLGGTPQQDAQAISA